MVSKLCQCLLLLLFFLAFLSNVVATAQCPVKGFSGQCFERDGQDNEYENWCYQYASTSMNYSHMKPDLILVAKSVADVKAAIAHARSKRVNMAVRTGGHQYSGASSTGGKNIQLDVSQAFKEFTVQSGTNNGVVHVRVGISLRLIDLYALLNQEGLFIPGGVCANVHVGGHVQTGGYGISIRAFGLFSDHVVSVEIITADGQTQIAARDSADKKLQDLYYAVLGGSPGNFGVITHIVIQPHQDKDYPNARAFRAIYTYTKEAAQNIIDFVPGMANMDQDYDLLITVQSGNKSLETPAGIISLPPIIFVDAQWSNIGGQSQPFDKKASDWFISIEQAFAKGGSKRLAFEGDPQNMEWNVTTPLSRMALNWAFLGIREYILPYNKRLYISNWDAVKLKQRGWVKWSVSRLDEFITERNKDEAIPVGTIEMFAQFVNGGGPNSKFFQNWARRDKSGRNLTALSWRDTTIAMTFDTFFNDSARADAQDVANAWQDQSFEEAFGPDGHFNDVPKEDAPKYFWESYGDRRMGNVWHQYHPTKAQYDRLLDIKRAVDPQPTVFTPNNFSVGVPKGVPDLPQPLWLTLKVFPITNQLIEESGLAAVDDHFVEWTWRQLNSPVPKTKSAGGSANWSPKRGGGGGGNRSPKRA